jgi:hypothetical protein
MTDPQAQSHRAASLSGRLSLRAVVEFGVGVGEYEGVVRIPRRVFQRLLDESPTPQRCLEAYYLHRTRFELAKRWPLRIAAGILALQASSGAFPQNKSSIESHNQVLGAMLLSVLSRG